jgi:hypothetical protein
MIEASPNVGTDSFELPKTTSYTVESTPDVAVVLEPSETS